MTVQELRDMLDGLDGDRTVELFVDDLCITREQVTVTRDGYGIEFSIETDPTPGL